ncbi:MAG: site-2 protease family protein [Candidatus Niyogibacteria bacterium]|nr:site-2 protease family protein [Candidatus Niyogibacteria bacterium]
MIADLAIFLGVLALLVLAHEFGHFLFARKFGVNVEEFGFGFPPRLGGVRRGGTLYSFNALPLGGFVKITGEDSAPVQPGEVPDPKNFASKSIGARAMILAAGIGFNLILAYILFAAALGIGVPVAGDDDVWAGHIADLRVVAIDVAPESAAERAGIQLGDAIIGLGAENGRETLRDISVDTVQKFVQEHRGKNISVTVFRDEQEIVLGAVLPDSASPQKGILGIAMEAIGRVDVPWWGIPWYALRMTAFVFMGTLWGIAALIAGAISGVSVGGMISGPVGIFSIVANTLDFGASYFVTLVATLSVNLAIVNLIPFPGLDGGRLLFVAIEKLRGRAISAVATRFANGLGFAILILLMVVITYYDIRLRL